MLMFSSRHQQFTCIAERVINKEAEIAPFFFLSFTLFLVSFSLFLVSLTSRSVEPCRTVPIDADLPHFRILGGFSKRHRRSRSRSKNPRRYTIIRRLRLKGRRARFNKSNTTMRYRPTDRIDEHARKTERRSELTQACSCLCLPAGLPACLLPACLIRRRTARGPHVVCLASGLFTC